jgi:DNA-binding NarL/FixJ family response regulator
MRLTPRQLEVVALLAQGLSYKAAGRRLSLTSGGINSHVQYMKKKLHCKSTFQLAFRLGLEARKALEKET